MKTSFVSKRDRRAVCQKSILGSAEQRRQYDFNKIVCVTLRILRPVIAILTHSAPSHYGIISLKLYYFSLKRITELVGNV